MEKRGHGEGTISKRIDGTWWGRVTVGVDTNGKQKRKAFYGKSRKEVQEKVTEAINRLNKGSYIEPSGMLLSEWIVTWLKEYRKKMLKVSTYRFFYYNIKNHIIPALGRYKLKELNVDVIQRLVYDLVGKKLVPHKVHDIIFRILKPCLEQAVCNEMLYSNPCVGISLPKMNTPDRAVMTKVEQGKFVEELSKDDDSRSKMLLLMLATGLRIAEALSLTWRDIDFAKQMLSVNKAQIVYRDPDNPDNAGVKGLGSPKSKASNRTIPLLSSIVGMLEALRQRQAAELGKDLAEDSWVFPSSLTGEMWCMATIDGYLKRVNKRLGLNSKLTLHCLRHTFATRGLECGIPLPVMRDLLGHASVNTTADLYTHVLPDVKQNFMLKMSGFAQADCGQAAISTTIDRRREKKATAENRREPHLSAPISVGTASPAQGGANGEKASK